MRARDRPAFDGDDKFAEVRFDLGERRPSQHIKASSPAKAGDPVFQGARSRLLWPKPTRLPLLINSYTIKDTALALPKRTPTISLQSIVASL
jgi:hypothetical protein